MLLTVDIGNSSINFGVFDDNGVLLFKSKISSISAKSADEYAVTISGILKLYGVRQDEIKSGIIASVVPSLTASVKKAVNILFGFLPSEIGPGTKTGLKIRIDSQTQLGADIVANSVAAISEFPSPLIIIDLGSVTTFTVIDEEKTLEGVMIAPGIRMSLDSLSSFAAKLPDVQIEKPKRIIAKNSEESMNAGVLYGHTFMIDGFINKIREEMKIEDITVVATGGLAKTVLPYCKSKIIYRPDLTLSGLKNIYLKNVK